MRRVGLFAALALVTVGCSSGGSATSAPGASQDGGTDPGSDVTGMQHGDPSADGGPGTVVGGGNGNKGGGNAGSDSGSDAGAPVMPSDPQQPACPGSASPRDNACVLSDAIGIFVSVSLGNDDVGDGTKAAPFSTLAKALPFAKAHNKRVFVCAETSSEAPSFLDGVPVFGGLDCAGNNWTVGTARAHFAPSTSPAARMDNVQNTTIIDSIEIVAPDATQSGGSSIGLIATSSPGASFVNVLVQAGNAMNGTDGVEGTQLSNSNGIDGANGIAPSVSSWFQQDPAGGGGGAPNVCGAGVIAPAGGPGGSGGNYKAVWDNFLGWQWLAGAPYTNASAATPGSGGNGGAGPSGANGASGSAGQVSASGFTPGDGTQGGNGSPGASGRGSDGASPAAHGITAQSQQNNTWFGVGGAGGGSGGCPGLAGTAGRGGGASIAIIAIGSSFNLSGSTLVAGNGGSGGAGTLGSSPTVGGNGGSGDLANPGGQHGGTGGNSGVSGAGAGGHSIAIAYSSGAPTVDGTSTMTIGNAGNGKPAMIFGAKTIPASANGVSQQLFSF